LPNAVEAVNLGSAPLLRFRFDVPSMIGGSVLFRSSWRQSMTYLP